MNHTPFFKLEVFVPEEAVDAVVSALADAHAGEIGLYDHCAAVSEVQTSWHAQAGATPLAGEPGKLYSGVEFKIEVNCREEFLADAVMAVREVHPYEEPVINIYPLANARYGGTV